MNKIATIAGFAVAATTMTTSAAVLLSVDLGNTNQITITATNGLSAISVSGSDFIGVLLADFFNDPSSSFNYTGDGSFSSSANTSDGSPNLFNGAVDFGLNIWSWSNEATTSFTAGSVAFAGSATWSLSAVDYANMLAGNTVGDIYFPASTDADIAGGPLLQGGSPGIIGNWTVVPAPSSLALLGFGGIAAGRRRR